MALLQVNFYSESLFRKTVFNAVVPRGSDLRTLYLLHGITENYTDWVTNTRVARWAEARKIAVIMPSADNSFYTDNEKASAMYGDFFGRELVEVTRELLPLSRKREDTFIAGLSMGGYGAVRTGLKYHETFGAIAGLSSALITDETPPPDDDSSAITGRRSYFETVFGDLDKVKGSDNDPKALIARMKPEEIPALYLCCGEEDFLIEQNRDFHRFLREKNVAHTYVEAPGAHNWDFWDEYIVKVLDWLEVRE